MQKEQILAHHIGHEEKYKFFSLGGGNDGCPTKIEGFRMRWCVGQMAVPGYRGWSAAAAPGLGQSGPPLQPA
jgi:hypothetical protein